MIISSNIKIKKLTLKRLLWILSAIKTCLLFVGILSIGLIASHISRDDNNNDKLYFLLLNKFSEYFIGGEFAVDNFNELSEVIAGAVRGFIKNNDYDHMNMKIRQNNLVKLRDSTKNNFSYVAAKLEIYDNQNNKKEIKVKVRRKGDRVIHFAENDTESYRVNIRGDDRFEGFEEFSIHHPVIRNFTWEMLLSSVMLDNGLLSVRTTPINFSVNGDGDELRFVEEVPGKELLEAQGRKEGPIFGLNEEVSSSFSSSVFDVYDRKYWLNDRRFAMYSSSIEVLNKTRSILNSNKFTNTEINKFIEEHYDVKLWARYFAISDLFGSYHGTVSKSVKFYYNPTTTLFEPILFDGHVGAGKFDNFILVDFRNKKDTVACEWICEEHKFYSMFFGSDEFYKEYISYLEIVSSEVFVKSVINKNIDWLSELNDQIYSRLMLSDKIFRRGLTPYHFDHSLLSQRKQLIRGRLHEIVTNGIIGKDNWLVKHNEIKDCLIEVDNQKNKQRISIQSGDILCELRDFLLEKNHVEFDDGVFLFTGNIDLTNDDSKHDDVSFDLKKSQLVFLDSTVDVNNLTINGGTDLLLHDVLWPGVLNFIRSRVVSTGGINVYDASSEDAMNFVSSNSEINKIIVSRSLSDGIDVDFGSFKVGSIKCKQIGNDCLDTSAAQVEITSLDAISVGDKAVSAGEGSSLVIESISSKSSSIGVVVKDSSNVRIGVLLVEDNDVDIAIYSKKPEYQHPSSLSVNEYVSDSHKVLFEEGSYVEISNYSNYQFYPKGAIAKMMYGNQFGSPTIKTR
jgi:hypothetical protein